MVRANITDGMRGIDGLQDPKLCRYEKLSVADQCIRLLRLQPGTKDQEVICELMEYNLSDRNEVHYEALSWCWGTGDRNRTILIRCGSSTFQSMVPQNLLEALVALRPTEFVRVLWVDALCINQADSEEKSIQIPMMSRIYRYAERVCIWLGQDEHNGAGIQFIKAQVLKLGSFDDLVDYQLPNTWRAIYGMLQADWFVRRWILQEILFAGDAIVYYGSESIAWQDFADAVSLFLKLQTSTHGISDVMKKDSRYYRGPGFFEYISELSAGIMISTSQNLFHISSDGHKIPLRGLENLVHECQMFHNSEPRDTIYALLGLANDTVGISGTYDDRQHLPNGHLSILSQPWAPWTTPKVNAYPVDYTQPYASHCKDFVEFVIRQCSQTDPTRALDILCRPWAPVPIEQGIDNQCLPSWVSSLSDAGCDMFWHAGMSTYKMGRKNAQPLVGPPHSHQSKHAGYYPASRDRGVDFSTLLFNKKPDYYSLYVSGFAFDRVEHVEVMCQGGLLPVDWLKAFGVKLEDGDMPLPDELWRTLVADRGPDGVNLPAYYKRACKELVKRANFVPGSIDLLDFIYHGRNALITDFCRRVRAMIWNRSLIRTRGGKFGLVRKNVEKDDLVCILYGCSVPVILREHVKDGQGEAMEGQAGIHALPGAEETFYELLGDCYVHGMMDGEAVDFQEKNCIQPVVFELR
jgi:hypothetical protein